MSIDVKRLKALKSRMNEDQKQKLLIGLRRMREDLGENPVDGNMLTTEDEFTGTGVTSTSSGTEPKVIAKTFDTNSDYDSYVNQRRGIEMTPKEITAIANYREAKPTQQDRFFVRYESTDDFGNNTTTVIKKLKEGGQFCWTAFARNENAEDEAKPEGHDEMKEQEQSEDEMTVDDPIRISKSITFMDDTQGADILANFIAALDI
jgi:hypothetical protein